MKLHYYPETDSLYIDLSSKVSANSKEVAKGIILDFDDHGDLVGIDIDHASKKLNLTTIETQDLPAGKTKIA